MPEAEGRFSRWSRLKRKGGATPEEDAAAKEDVEEAKTRGRAAPVAVAESADPEAGEAETYFVPDPKSLPGGIQKRSFVAPMKPLAEPEEGESTYEAAPADALALLTGDPSEDDEARAISLDDAGETEVERELTAEEQEAVDALPPIDSLTKESDFTPFMAEKIPEFIRRRALRVLWRSDPLLANLDGLNDYDEDFNVIDKLIDAATGNYKVGKGMPGPGDEDWEEEQKKEAESASSDVSGQENPIKEPDVASFEEPDEDASGEINEDSVDDADDAEDTEPTS